jgi:hypothetical protein
VNIDRIGQIVRTYGAAFAQHRVHGDLRIIGVLKNCVVGLDSRLIAVQVDPEELFDIQTPAEHGRFRFLSPRPGRRGGLDAAEIQDDCRRLVLENMPGVRW